MADDGFEHLDGLIESGAPPETGELAAALSGRRRRHDQRRLRAGVGALAVVAVMALLGQRLLAGGAGDDELRTAQAGWSAEASELVATMRPECVNFMTDRWGQRVDLVVFMDPEANAAEIAAMAEHLEAEVGPENVFYLDKEGAYEEFARLFRSQPEMIDTVTPDILPSSFGVQVGGDLTKADAIQASVRDMPGVRDVTERGPLQRSLDRADPDTRLLGDPVYLVITPVEASPSEELLAAVRGVMGGAEAVPARGETAIAAEVDDPTLGRVLDLIDEFSALDGVALVEVSSTPEPPLESSFGQMDTDELLESCVGAENVPTGEDSNAAANDIVANMSPECLDHINDRWPEAVDLVVVMRRDATPAQREVVRARLESLVGLENTEYLELQEAYDQFVRTFGEEPKPVDSQPGVVEESSFRVSLDPDGTSGREVAADVVDLEGVNQVVQRSPFLALIDGADPNTMLRSDVYVIFPAEGEGALAVGQRVHPDARLVEEADSPPVIVVPGEGTTLSGLFDLRRRISDPTQSREVSFSSRPGMPTAQLGGASSYGLWACADAASPGLLDDWRVEIRLSFFPAITTDERAAIEANLATDSRVEIISARGDTTAPCTSTIRLSVPAPQDLEFDALLRATGAIGWTTGSPEPPELVGRGAFEARDFC